MKTDDLHQAIQQLHEELARAKRVDPESERLLRELLADISKLTGERDAGRSPVESSGVVDRLVEASKDFEEQHPGLVTAIGRLADALSRIGV
jgi:hypothetical protein